jgi:hypothetical protein
MGRKVKTELHTHPLLHKYYLNSTGVILDNDDKKDIARMVNWAISLGIEVLCPCDHDSTESSIWAQEYVRSMNLPIQIVTGTEVATWEPSVKEEVHIGAYGILKTPKCGRPINETLKAIHDQGGIAILNHPNAYDKKLVYQLLKSGKFDGYEIYNHCQEIAKMFEHIEYLISVEGYNTEEACKHPKWGGGVFHPEYIDKEMPNLLQIQSSDNHNHWEYYQSIPYVPGYMNEDYLKNKHLIR